MDPVTFTLLAIAGVAIAPKVIPYTLYKISKLVDKIKANNKKRRKRKERIRRRKAALNSNTVLDTIGKNLEKNRVVEFTSIKNNTKKSISVKENSSFDLENDVLLRGVVRVRLKDGRIAEDDIYLFQPRLFGANGVAIGPKLSNNGNLLDQNGYLLRVPGDTSIYRGYVPKREVMSGSSFDFVRDSAYATKNDPLVEFIDIEIPKDQDGNFIPVDKKNKSQMEAFQRYVEGRRKYKIDQNAYLQDLISAAKDAKAEYDYINRPVYARPVMGPDPKEMQRIRKARASQAKREAQAQAYYGTINRMNMIDNMMHAYNLDEHAAHMPGAMMGMPGMGLGPGMIPLSSMHNNGPLPPHGSVPGGPAPGGRHR